MNVRGESGQAAISKILKFRNLYNDVYETFLGKLTLIAKITLRSIALPEISLLLLFPFLPELSLWRYIDPAPAPQPPALLLVSYPHPLFDCCMYRWRCVHRLASERSSCPMNSLHFPSRHSSPLTPRRVESGEDAPPSWPFPPRHQSLVVDSDLPSA